MRMFQAVIRRQQMHGQQLGLMSVVTLQMRRWRDVFAAETRDSTGHLIAKRRQSDVQTLIDIKFVDALLRHKQDNL